MQAGRDYNFPLHPVDTSPLGSNTWFAGFVEADGSFYIRTTESPLKIAPQFVLEQRNDSPANGNYQEIMEALAHFLLSNLKSLQRKGKGTSFRALAQDEGPRSKTRVRKSSLAGNLVLISYLTSFPLFGSKRLDYFDWCQSVELVAKGNHQTTQALASMKRLKTNMNNNLLFLHGNTLSTYINLKKLPGKVCHSTLFNLQVRYSPIQAVTFGEPAWANCSDPRGMLF